MSEHLKEISKLIGWRLIIILVIFTMNGSTTVLLRKVVVGYLNIAPLNVNAFVYFVILLITILIINIPFGRLVFTRKDFASIGNRSFIRKKN